jgi:hypothetical protein
LEATLPLAGDGFSNIYICSMAVKVIDHILKFSAKKLIISTALALGNGTLFN